ncbi:MAG: hypothetical protein M1833_003695 [Piccolia ochrophora]|nr:MAG: hypothetical protein M1833_003695 [Piccolia ochrophora]
MSRAGSPVSPLPAMTEETRTSQGAHQTNQESHDQLLGGSQSPTPKRVSEGKARYYQPTITRLPSLIALFLVTLTLIALTELSVHRLPDRTSNGAVNSLVNKTLAQVSKINAREALPLPQTPVAAPPSPPADGLPPAGAGPPPSPAGDEAPTEAGPVTPPPKADNPGTPTSPPEGAPPDGTFTRPPGARLPVGGGAATPEPSSGAPPDDSRLPIGEGDSGTPRPKPPIKSAVASDIRLPVGDGGLPVGNGLGADTNKDIPVGDTAPDVTQAPSPDKNLPVGDAPPRVFSTPAADVGLPVGDSPPDPVPLPNPEKGIPPTEVGLPVGGGAEVGKDKDSKIGIPDPDKTLPVGPGQGGPDPDGGKDRGKKPSNPHATVNPDIGLPVGPGKDGTNKPPPPDPDIGLPVGPGKDGANKPSDPKPTPDPDVGLPVGPGKDGEKKPPDPHATVNPDIGLPVGPGKDGANKPSDPKPTPDPDVGLPVGPGKDGEKKPPDPHATVNPDIGLPVGPGKDGANKPSDPKPTPDPDVGLPVGPGKDGAKKKPSDPQQTIDPGQALPVGSGKQRPEAPDSGVHLPTSPDDGHGAKAGAPPGSKQLPVNDGGSDGSPDAADELPVTSEGKSDKVSGSIPVDNSGKVINAPRPDHSPGAPFITKGTVNGIDYSVNPSGVVVGGKTYPTGTPRTAALPSGQYLVVDKDGNVRIKGSKDDSITSAVVIGGKTYATAKPTTATLPDGKKLVIDKDGKVHITRTVNGLEYEDLTTGLAVAGKTYATATPTTATLPNGQTLVIGNDGKVSLKSKPVPLEKMPSHGVSYRDYVVGAFVPTMVAVLFSIPWYILDRAIKQIEPFYQLKRPEGASATNSLCMDYSTSVLASSLVRSFYHGHLVVFWSSVVSLAVLLLPPLAAEAVFIGFDGVCTAKTGPSACHPMLAVSPVAARIIEGILTFMAIMTLFIAIANMRRKTGVYGSPFSIAGLATLFQSRNLVTDFRHVDPDTGTTRQLAQALDGRRYRIGPYTESDGTSAYGITICQYNPTSVVLAGGRVSEGKDKKQPVVHVAPVNDESTPKRRGKGLENYYYVASLTASGLLLAGLMVVLIYYNRTGGDTPFERFMQSQSFGTRFLFTATGVAIKLFWSHLDDEVRRLEPYRNLLSKSEGAFAVDSIIMAPHNNQYTGFFDSLYHLRVFPAYLSFLTMICEPLTVALSNIPYSPGVSHPTYVVCHNISVSILAAMLLGIIWAIVRERRRLGQRGHMLGLVRQPDCIASVLLYICGSRMLPHFAGMGTMKAGERRRYIIDWEKKYAMGSVVGIDGVERDGIDEKRNVEKGWVGVVQR